MLGGDFIFYFFIVGEYKSRPYTYYNNTFIKILDLNILLIGLWINGGPKVDPTFTLLFLISYKIGGLYGNITIRFNWPNG